MYLCVIKNDIKGFLLAQGCVRYIGVLMYDQTPDKRGPFGSRMRYSPPNLRFDLDKIATQGFFVVTISKNPP